MRTCNTDRAAPGLTVFGVRQEAARTDDRQGTLIELKNDGGMWTVEEDVSAVVALVMKAQAYPADTPYPLAVPDVAEEGKCSRP